MSFDVIADVARQLRTSLIAAYRENYVTGAVVRGLSPRRIFFGHVLRNGLGPALATLGLKFPTLVGASVVTEWIFGLQGFGRFANPALFLTVVTGVVQTWRLDRGEVFGSSHGRGVVLKVVIVVAMILVGLATRQFVRSRLANAGEMTAPLAARTNPARSHLPFMPPDFTASQHRRKNAPAQTLASALLQPMRRTR